MKIRPKTLSHLNELFRTRNASGLLKAASDVQAQAPNSIIGRVFTARALALEKRFGSAAEILESIILPFPKLRKVYLEYLGYLRQAGRRAQWEIQAFRFLEYHDSAKLCLQLGQFFYRRKEWKRSLHCFRKLEELGSEKISSAHLEYLLGLLTFKLGDHVSAGNYLKEIYTDEAFHLKAKIYFDQGSYRKALESLRSMGNLHACQQSLGLGARICKGLKDVDGEQEFLEKLIKFPSDSSGRWKILERLEVLAMGQNDRSYRLQVVNAKRKLQPTNLALKKQAASLYWELNSQRRAVRLYEQVQKEDPFDADVLERLSSYFEDKGNLQRAFYLLKSGYIGGSNSFPMDLRYAQLALRQGRIPEARDVLHDLLKCGKSRARIYYLLATAYELEGREDVSRYYKGLYDQYLPQKTA
ncbi:tetratricopeptide repeat protein [bacterium]|jgi:Tfp pilus assembly protein PilF|nr:tetratricopeptide repeat protein [bacterium]